MARSFGLLFPSGTKHENTLGVLDWGQGGPKGIDTEELSALRWEIASPSRRLSEQWRISKPMTPPLPLEFMLVSSDYAAAMAISRGIKNYGAKASLSPGADAARDTLRRRKVDGVFVDMELPGTLELIIDIRKGTSNSKSVIFACVLSSKESTVTLSAGANFLLLKPLAAESVALHIQIAKEMLEREHRRYFRHPVNLLVLLKNEEGEQRAKMVNLSEGGMALRPTRGLKHSSMIDFEFEVGFGAVVSGRGQVAWTSKEGMAGILIHTFQGKGRDHLEAWLSSREQLSTPPVAAETSS
jgi:ActR/RegA family two-component response regulator